MCTFKNSLREWNDRRPLFSHPKFINNHVVLNDGSRVDLAVWNNSAWNPPQYFVENNWFVCLLSCISQSLSPFTLTCILTTPNWNCLDQLLMNTISPCIGSSLKLCTFIANQKASICWRHSIGNKSRSWIGRRQAGICYVLWPVSRNGFRIEYKQIYTPPKGDNFYGSNMFRVFLHLFLSVLVII